MWDRCFFSILLGGGEITGKAHKLLTGAIENDKVAGDNFHYKHPCCSQQLEMVVSLIIERCGGFLGVISPSA